MSQSYFINRDEGFRTRYLQWSPKIKTDKMPIVCIHGNLSNATMFNWIGELLSSVDSENARQVVAIDIRGCGESGMPEKGFTLQHMASDIEAVLNRLNITKAHFIAYSRGVAYVLQFALRHKNCVHGLVVGDFPAYYEKLNKEWAIKMQDSYNIYSSWDELFVQVSTNLHISRTQFEQKIKDYYIEENGVIRKRYAKDLPMRMYLESSECSFSHALNNINGKMLVIKGNESGPHLDEEQLSSYQMYDPIILRLNNVGHDVFELRPQVREALLHYYYQLK